MQIGLYIASVVGALALLLIMPKKSITLPKLGGLLGAFALGGAWLFIANQKPQWTGADSGLPGGALPYYYIFSGLAILSAVRVITHTKPVYSALWFVMVVLASSGLFITLSADFMALAMVIIYGGAILVTYVFVIMLAAHSATDESEEEEPEYERVARAPVGSVVAGFVLLAALLTVAFDGDLQRNPAAAARTDEQVLMGIADPQKNIQEPRLLMADRRAVGRTVQDAPPEQREALAEALNANSLSNAERVGLDLFQGNPLGLELAGVILLVSLIGAVIIARKVVDEEQEVRS